MTRFSYPIIISLFSFVFSHNLYSHDDSAFEEQELIKKSQKESKEEAATKIKEESSDQNLIAPKEKDPDHQDAIQQDNQEHLKESPHHQSPNSDQKLDEDLACLLGSGVLLGICCIAFPASINAANSCCAFGVDLTKMLLITASGALGVVIIASAAILAGFAVYDSTTHQEITQVATWTGISAAAFVVLGSAFLGGSIYMLNMENEESKYTKGQNRDQIPLRKPYSHDVEINF